MATKIPSFSGTGFGTKKTGTKIPPATATAPPSTGLAAWWKSDAGVATSGSNVTSWTDQTGNGYVATSVTSPVLTSSVINGLPGITFSTVGQELKNTSTSILTAGTARTVVAACKPTSGSGVFTAGGNVFVFRLTTNTFALLAGIAGGSTYGYSNSAASAALTSPPSITDVPLVVEMYSAGTGTTPTYVINGTTYALAVSPTVAAESGTAGFTIGNLDAAQLQFFAGSICEILIWDHVLSAGDTTTMRQYMQKRTAINLGV